MLNQKTSIISLLYRISLRTLEYQPVKVDTKPLLDENKLDLKQTM